MADCIGWDLGGAHLKAVRLDAAGRVQAVIQLPCPLWQGLPHLENAIDQALVSMGSSSLHAITMTGELADIFPDRRTGVASLVGTIARKLPEVELRIFSGRDGFVAPGQVEAHADWIASANWLASAEFAARRCGQGVFVDMGTTTTDIVAMRDGRAQPQGMSDAERLASEELVYTGVVRTPVMAVAQRVPFNGRMQRLAAEHFATMADVHRLTGRLEESYDMAETADGAGKSRVDSARRLARMVGRDLGDAPMLAWNALAHFIANAQLQDVAAAFEHVSAGIPGPVVGAGAGRFAVRELARRSGREYIDFSELIEGEAREWAAVCAPAFAVAWLASEATA
jgi:(4-(4-[2-(gamma-L-glutamylamino)ethyl]phenoxymethyl)furan-2-yl)methanamine synthase